MLLAALALVAAGCGGGDGEEDGASRDARSGSSDHGDASRSEDTTAGHGGDDGDADDEADPDQEEGEPTAMPEPVPAGQKPPILVTAPAPFDQLVRSFVLRGSAQVHEGALVWAILDAKLKPMASGRFNATCGAPCRGTFSTRISLAKVPIGSWELHVWAPNAADDGPARLHDTMVPVTVSDRRTPGAPEPGAVPPGGPPQS